MQKRRREPNKNRWVSSERNDGTAMGAVCDWSLPSLCKPFFSLRHVQSVDKRHHPTDSLINCEMYSYLPLSYSRAPKTLLFSTSTRLEKEETNWTPRGFPFERKKKEKIALLAHFLFQDVVLTPSCTQAFTHRDKREHTQGQRRAQNFLMPTHVLHISVSVA